MSPAAFVASGGSSAVLLGAHRHHAHRCPRHVVAPRRGRWAMAADQRHQRPLLRSVKVGLVGLAALVSATLAGPNRVRAAAGDGAHQGAPVVRQVHGRRARAGILAAASSTATPRKISTEKELSDNERLISMGMTAAATAGLFFWAFRRNRKDDEDESVRIKNEVDRLEKWKKEFLDVEEGDESIPDDEMMGELRKRMGLPEPEETGEPDGEDAAEDRSPATASATETPKTSAPDASAASETDEKNEEEAAEEDAEVSQENLDMLRRMFEGSEESDKPESRDDRQGGPSGPSSAVLERPDGDTPSESDSKTDPPPPSPPSEQVDFLNRMWDADSKKDKE